MNGIGPEDLNLESLFTRIEQEHIEEIVIATNPNVEGETTALYLAKRLANYPVQVTRLAYGLPVGGNLDYADEFTLLKAIEGRRSIKL
jgi:recombination protein RecR